MTKHTILFLAADPDGTDARALGREARSIQEELERSGHRDCFEFETRWAATPLDVLRELRKLRPTVVHFGGHGGRSGLFFQAADGRAQRVSTAALGETFGAIGASVRLVVLSACYSEAQAEALLAHVDCVVGVRGGTRRDVARTFAIGFYGGLGERASVAAAHRQGCAAISLEGLSDRAGPQLKVRDGIDAARLILADLALAARLPSPRPARPFALAADRQRRAELVREIHVRLLAGDPAEAAVHAGLLAEALRRYAPGDELLGDFDELDELCTRAARDPRSDRGELIDDAERAAELVIQAAIRAGLLDEAAARDARLAAERQASEPPPAALLRLDRAAQRRSLDDLLALRRRVLVMLIHGEVGQGHDHFGEVASWRTRAVAKGRWRQLHVEWPAPSPSTETRLGFLLESFASALGATFSPPPRPPAADGEPAWEAAWIDALEAALSACDRARERLFVRHVIGWLDRGDVELVARYMRMVWIPLAARRGAQLVCCLELRRAERTGVPFFRAWRTARSEHGIARAIAASLEEQTMPSDGHCTALPELTSASAEDVADWLRAERQLARSAAISRAQELVTMTRGGRFELVVQRLAAFNLDTRSARR